MIQNIPMNEMNSPKAQIKFIHLSFIAPMADRRPNWNSGVKRQDGEDVDHVFLRFGKRG